MSDQLSQNPEPQVDPVPEKKSNFLIILLIAIFCLALGAGAMFAWQKYQEGKPEDVACTMDAKICPDGSSVGRLSPDCQFAPCPLTPSPSFSSTSQIPEGWKTRVEQYRDFNIQVSYPGDWFLNAGNFQISTCDTNKPSCVWSDAEYLEIRIVSETITENLSNEQYLEQFIQTKQGSIAQSRILVDGISAIKNQWNTPAGDAYTVFFVRNDNLIEITAQPISSKNISIFDQILGTFRFIDSVPAEQIASPLPAPITYTDEEYGYKITYNDKWLFRRTYGKGVSKSVPDEILSGIDLHLNYGTYTQASIVVNVLDSHGETEIEQWIKKYDLNYPKEAIKSPNYNFNGQNSIKYYYIVRENTPTERIYLLKGNNAYRITYSENFELSEEAKTVAHSFKID